ncbi:MAG: hypothetical protein D6762_04825, partial [Candidatus Neomarinimicrobiota bacterium]
IHFVIDILFAVPLLVVPGPFLHGLGFTVVEPLATRLVAAALMGIGGISFLARNASADTFRHLLLLKLLWSATASLGILITLLADAYGSLWFVWAIWGIFTGFFGIWWYYYRKLTTIQD